MYEHQNAAPDVDHLSGAAVDIMRKGLNGMRSDEAVENILNLFARTKSNKEVIAQVGKRRL